MNKSIIAIAVLLYNFALVAGTAFLIVEYSWSMWTFLITMVLMMRTTKDDE